MLNDILYSLNSMMANPILTLAAVVPAIVLMILVFKTDKLNKEPIGLLLSLIVLGILSTQLAALAENIGGTVLGLFWDKNSLIFRLLFYFIVVGGSEELAKYILLRWRTWRHKAFDCQFDGVVYAVFISLGFALWENISYSFSYGFETALIRAVTAVPLHGCCGVFMGLWYGAAKRYDFAGNTVQSKLRRRLAVLFPMLLHGAYDFIASSENPILNWSFTGFVILVFIISFIAMKKAARQDRFIENPSVIDIDVD